MSIAEEVRENDNRRRTNGGRNATTSTNSLPVTSGYASQLAQFTFGGIGQFGGNSTNQYSGQCIGMSDNVTAGASKPTPIDLLRSNISDAILDNATDEQLDAMIAAAMPSLEELEDMAAGDSSEWLDDTSWIDDVD